MNSGRRFTSFFIAICLAVTGPYLIGSSSELSARDQGRGAQAAARQDPCAAPANDIVTENCKLGNPPEEWDINGAGDPTIQGFGTDISVNRGETILFKVKTDSPKYRIDVYRLGYYAGKGARLVTAIRPSVSLPQTQPECLMDYTTRLTDCGNWQVSASWAVPVDATSGIYIARLVREDPPVHPNWRADNSQERPVPKPAAMPHAYGASGLGKLRNAIREPRASHIVFIVRDDEGQSDILLQTSDLTWQVYNRYGLGSTYTGVTPDGTPTGQANRAYKVSYNRPFTDRSGYSVEDWLFNAEYPMVRWLEANGFDVSYFTGVDSDRRGEEIQEHKIFLSVGHDEYWSGSQRKNVESARDDAGVNLGFFSGNEVFWKVRLEPSVDGTNTPSRTVVCYKDTHSRIDPDGELQPGRKLNPMPGVWTGTWRDSSPFNPEGPQPENALTGTIFTVNSWQNDPLQVPAEYGKLRFWRNTDIAKLKPGETATLGRGIVGYEFDEPLDNGFQPAGLIHLSETTINGVLYLQDFGSVYDGGTATHHLTLYRAKSGALVFGSGTVQLSWGLDNFHDMHTGVPAARANRYSIRLGVDPNSPVRAIQQATVNLFADMSVQPTNLQPGLVPATESTDALAPVSQITSPLDGSTVATGVIRITGTATDNAGGIVAGVEVSVDDGRRWRRAKGREHWSYEWDVPQGVSRATILSRATDDSGNTAVSGHAVTLVIGPSPSATP